MKKITFLSVFACLAIASFAQTSPQDYTSDGTFTVPTGVNTITVEVVGAGGKGPNNGGGGGGGGGYAKGTFSVTPGSTLSITVGTTNGATSAITSLGIQATGGSNGSQLTSQPYMVGGGGTGGIGSGGNISNATGGDGGGGRWTYWGGGGGGAAGPNGNGSVGGTTINYAGVCSEQGGAGGNNGGFPGGSGGKGAGYNNGSCGSQNANPAIIGLNYGGAGGAGNGSGSPGTDGAKGFVRILWGLATGMESVTLTQVTTYPNPFTSTINVKNNRGNETYTLTNTVGEVIWNGKNINDQSFSQLQKGVYFLSITTYNNSYVQKLIKE